MIAFFSRTPTRAIAIATYQASAAVRAALSECHDLYRADRGTVAIALMRRSGHGVPSERR
jgi:hypothetical protein